MGYITACFTIFEEQLILKQGKFSKSLRWLLFTSGKTDVKPASANIFGKYSTVGNTIAECYFNRVQVQSYMYFSKFQLAPKVAARARVLPQN